MIYCPMHPDTKMETFSEMIDKISGISDDLVRISYTETVIVEKSHKDSPIGTIKAPELPFNMRLSYCIKCQPDQDED